MNFNLNTLMRLIIDIGSYCLILLSIFLIDKSVIALSTFIIIYTNRESLYYTARQIDILGDIFTNIKICKQRMFSLYDEEEFMTQFW